MSIKSCVIFFLLLAVTPTSHAADEAKQALDDARSLAKAGNYPAALEKHIWFHDHALEIDRSYYGVRLSFALSDWLELGNKYPPALEKLKEIRDEKMTRLATGEANRELFHDIESINQTLTEEWSTTHLFKRIDSINPKFAGEIGDLVLPALVKNREWVLARKYLGDPNARLAAAKRNFDETISMKSAKNPAALRNAAITIFTEDVQEMALILKETGDTTEAKRIEDEGAAILKQASVK